MSGKSLTRWAPAVLALVLVLAVAACGSSTSGTASPAATPAANLSAQQIARQTEAKMAQVKSAAFTADLSLQVNGDPGKITDPTQKALLGQGVKLHVQGKSSVQPPASDMTMNLSFAGQNLDFSMIDQGGKAWIQYQGKWYELDGKTSKSLGPLTGGSGATPSQQLEQMGLDPLALGATYTLVGTETLNGTQVYHLKATVDPKRLGEALAKASKDPKIAKSLGGQLKQLQQLGVQGKTSAKQLEKTFKNVSVDYWVGTGDMLVRKVNAVVDVSGAGASKSASAAPDMTMTLNVLIADFDKPVTVTPPANAAPFSQLMNQIFGGMMQGAGSGLSL